MIIYTVKIEDRFGMNDILLSTEDKQLAEETVKVVKILFTNVKAVIGFKSEEMNTHHVWWYDEYFSNQFLEDIWNELKERGFDPSYC